MERRIAFIVPGTPIAQGRPKFSTHGGFARAYDPKKSKVGKNLVKMCAAEAMRKNHEEPLEGPIYMKVQFGIEMPKSQARKRIPRPRIWRVKKPDLDNLVKLIKDGCSKVVFLDDNQIVKLSAEKIQCRQGEPPFTKVVFTSLQEISDD